MDTHLTKVFHKCYDYDQHYSREELRYRNTECQILADNVFQYGRLAYSSFLQPLEVMNLMLDMTGIWYINGTTAIGTLDQMVVSSIPT